MKHLFICATPIQVMTAINLRITELFNDEVTLYILDHSHMNENMYNKIVSANIFTNVLLLKTLNFNKSLSQKKTITRYFTKVIQYFNYEKISATIVNDKMIYDKFWVSFMDDSSWLLYLSYKKRNTGLQLFYFEDGMGSYQLLTIKENPLHKLFSYVFGFFGLYKEINALYLYAPELGLNTLYPSIEIKALPKINDEKVLLIMNEIFSFKSMDLKLLNYKYIYFDSPYGVDTIDKHQTRVINFLMERMDEQFCLKLHPRSLMTNIEYAGNISNLKMPLEMLCLNKDTSNNVFITIISTVGITPKLMFNQEPVIIFLFKIIKMDKIKYIGNEIFGFIENLKKNYVNSNRIFIPESMQELEEILERLDSK